eukprot:2267086-Heterocapsa_arctica.AAC.1
MGRLSWRLRYLVIRLRYLLIRLRYVAISLRRLAHHLCKLISVSSGIQWRWREVSPIITPVPVK